MSVKPLNLKDSLRINIATIFNKLYYKVYHYSSTLALIFRIIGDLLVRWAKIKYNDTKYVLIDLSSLSIFYKNYEPNVLRIILNQLSKGDVFIDIGAHIGKYSFLSAKKVGANGKVIAVEPNPIAFKALKSGIKENRLANVIPLNIAVSNNNAIIQFYLFRSSVGSGMKVSEGSYNTIFVKSMTLDTLVNILKLNRVNFIKIDVEGAELEVLMGAMNTLINYKPQLIIEVWDINFKNVTAFLRKIGYNCEVIERYAREKYSNIYCR